jgi:hypothetical protein
MIAALPYKESHHHKGTRRANCQAQVLSAKPTAPLLRFMTKLGMQAIRGNYHNRQHCHNRHKGEIVCLIRQYREIQEQSPKKEIQAQKAILGKPGTMSKKGNPGTKCQ